MTPDIDFQYYCWPWTWYAYIIYVIIFVDAIHALVGTGKDVYVGIQYVDDYREWIELLDPTDNDPIFNTKVNNLVTYLKNSQISGVIMQGLLLYVSKKNYVAFFRVYK